MEFLELVRLWIIFFWPSIRFWTGISKTPQVFRWNCFWIIPCCWIICFQKSVYWSIYTVRTSKMVFSCFPGKLDPDRVFFPSKNIFKLKILKNDSDSESTFFQCIRFWSKNGFRKNRIWCKLSAQKTTRGSFYNLGTPRFVVMSFPKRTILGKKVGIINSLEIKTFEKNQILKQLFQQRDRFSIKISKRRRTFSQLYTTQQTVNRKFYSVSGFEMKALRRIRFWSEFDFRKTEFDENFPFKESLLDLYTP